MLIGGDGPGAGTGDFRVQLRQGEYAKKEGVGSGAGNGTRTRGLDLGKVALYQLSYARTDDGSAGTTTSTARQSRAVLYQYTDGWDEVGVVSSYAPSLTRFNQSRSIRALVSSIDVAQDVANLMIVWSASLRSQKSKATCSASSSIFLLSRRTKV